MPYFTVPWKLENETSQAIQQLFLNYFLLD
jgi:hypothetical protein